MSNPIGEAIRQLTDGRTDYLDAAALSRAVLSRAKQVQCLPNEYHLGKRALAAGIIIGSSWISPGPGFFRNNIEAYWRKHCQPPEPEPTRTPWRITDDPQRLRGMVIETVEPEHPSFPQDLTEIVCIVSDGDVGAGQRWVRITASEPWHLRLEEAHGVTGGDGE